MFIIAAHMPILMAYLDVLIYRFSVEGFEPVDYENTEHFQIAKLVLLRRESMLRELMQEDNAE